MSKELVDHVHIWTDGSIIPNPGGSGGLGILVESKRLGLSKVIGIYIEEEETNTNNRMEVMALLVALRAVKESPMVIHVYSDSTYLLNGINKEYSTNVDLWEQFRAIHKEHFYYINPIHVKGHDGNERNELVDNVANIARKEERSFDVRKNTLDILEKYRK